MDKINLCSGFGQYHTDRIKPYSSVTLDKITELTETPTRLAKDNAQWVIPSTLLTRVHAEQREKGIYHAIWGDIDEHTELESIKDVLAELVGHNQYLIYSSSRSKEEKKKWRVFIPLAHAASGNEFKTLAQILNDRLERGGIVPDRASERYAQIFYLPNRDPDESKFYDHFISDAVSLFDWREILKDELAQKKQQAQERQQREEQAKEQARIKAAERMASGELLPRNAYKACYDLETMMHIHGYTKKGHKWISPKSGSGKAGVTIKGSKWISSHASDAEIGRPYDGGTSGDVFDLFVHYECNGNEKAAVIAAGAMFTTPEGISITQANQNNKRERDNREKAMNGFDDVTNNDEELAELVEPTPSMAKDDAKRIDLLRHIDDGHIIKRLVKSVCAATELPESTVLLNALGVFSSVATRQWKVNYQHYDSVPIGLYVVTEQPSGTSKSRSLGAFQSPFFKERKRLMEEALKKIESLGLEEKEEKDKIKWIESKTLFVTNTTPEALEQSLNGTGGYFSAVASEQGLINTLLGLSYGDGKAPNNDLVLNGFDGGYMNSIRVSRNGHNGNVAGGVTLFAQSGSIETLLKQSNGTGLAERFLMLAEKHNLGKRTFLNKAPIDRAAIDIYEQYCGDVISGFFHVHEPYALNLCDFSWRDINEFREEIEPFVADGQKYSHGSLRGAVNKVDIQIMKIASCLQLLTPNNKADFTGQLTIDRCHVKSAIEIVRDLTQEHLAMLSDKGLIGQRAEFEVIIRLFERSPTRSLEQIRTSKTIREQEPFKSSSNISEMIRNTLAELVSLKILHTVNGKSYTLIS
jgi:hypothetical protein